MKSKTKFGRFLSHDITLMVLSVLIALCIWFAVNAGSEVEGNVPINNIPVTIELSKEATNDGLQAFTKDELTASVEVKGNRLIVGSLTSADIQIVALDANSIVAPGQYELELTAKKTGVRTNYSFASPVSPSTIDVYVDRLKEKSFDIVDEIVYKLDNNYYNNSSMSETSVKVSGPETEVNAIDKVVVQGELEGRIGSTTSDKFNLVFLDKDGNKINTSLFKLSLNEVLVTMKPIPTKEVMLDVDVVNAPKGVSKYTVSPNRIKIAAEKEILDSISKNKVVIGSLDYSQLANKEYTLNYDITLPNGCKNLSGSTSAEVMIDLSGYASKKIQVENFGTENIDRKQYNVLFNSGAFEVTVCGPQELIDTITPKNIVPKVDFEKKLSDVNQDSFSLELPFKFNFTSEYKKCWVYGNYSVVVNVTKKQ